MLHEAKNNHTNQLFSKKKIIMKDETPREKGCFHDSPLILNLSRNTSADYFDNTLDALSHIINITLHSLAPATATNHKLFMLISLPHHTHISPFDHHLVSFGANTNYSNYLEFLTPILPCKKFVKNSFIIMVHENGCFSAWLRVIFVRHK